MTAPERKPSRDPILVELRRRRHALGMTQRDVAERIGIGQRNISDMERGRSAPNLHTLRRWAAAVHCQVEATPGPDWPLTGDVDHVAVERVARGEQAPLNAAEQQVAYAVLSALGLSSKVIAERLQVSQRTIVRRRSASTPVHRLSTGPSTVVLDNSDERDAA